MKVIRFFTTTIALGLAALAGVAGYRVLESQLEADVYRQRLADTERDLVQLRDQYEQVVRRTAVTELVVTGGVLSVHVRAGDGSILSLPTPFDPSREIYVDYVVIDGRLWIRRIFDEDTAPGQGMLIDPALGDVDWDADEAAQGKASYRALGEGRWVISVSGNGALDLARAREDEVVRLAAPPPIREWSPAQQEAQDALRDLEPEEVFRELTRRITSPTSPISPTSD